MRDSTISNAGDAFVLAPGEGTPVWFLGTLMTLKAAGETTRHAFGLIEQVLPPGFAPPPHVHHREDEAFYILEGQLRFSCGDRTWQTTPGTFVFLPRGIVHGFRVEGSQPARLLQFNTPAGIEHFFVQAGEPAQQRALPPAGPPQVDKVLARAEAYGIDIMGPPPEPA
jgi:quercetin dioxygenase-like cupin family protein